MISFVFVVNRTRVTITLNLLRVAIMAAIVWMMIATTDIDLGVAILITAVIDLVGYKIIRRVRAYRKLTR